MTVAVPDLPCGAASPSFGLERTSAGVVFSDSGSGCDAGRRARIARGVSHDEARQILKDQQASVGGGAGLFRKVCAR
jgi:hypothetical protein